MIGGNVHKRQRDPLLCDIAQWIVFRSEGGSWSRTTELWSSAANVPLESFSSPACPKLMEADRVEIFRNVRDAAAQVIAAKGATNWAVGLAVVRILEAILRDEQSVLTVSSLLEDCGIPDVCISVPCLMGWQGVGPTLPLPYSEPELTALKHSAELLKATARGRRGSEVQSLNSMA